MWDLLVNLLLQFNCKNDNFLDCLEKNDKN